MSRIIKYVDPHQTVFWFEEEPCGDRNPNFYYGTIIKIRPGWTPNIHEWRVGDLISVAKNVCVIDTHMNYKVETRFGCTSTEIIINEKNYSCEDPRYALSDQEREQFNDALLAEIVRKFNVGELGPLELIQLLPVDEVHCSDACACETCGFNVVLTSYSF